MTALRAWSESHIWAGEWNPTYDRNEAFKANLHPDYKGLQLVWEDGHIAHLREGTTFAVSYPLSAEDATTRIVRFRPANI